MRHDFPLMLFAAGFGTRMGALTATRPKPLIPVAGRPLIDHALAIADQAGVGRRVANVHYLGGQIADHLAGTGVAISHEAGRILDTAGGLKAALPLLGAGPVMTLNTDAVWAGENPLTRLAEGWDPARMDALLLLLPAAQARSQTGRSDFVLDDASGRIDWAGGREGHLYLGAQIVDPALIAAMADEVIPMRTAWDRWIAAGRAHGIVYRGDWCDVGHPDGIAGAEAMLAAAHG